ncbi:uncharacterized protein LOC120802906 [Xiphias gladius]|uniref:uncharacterized protein LOC120802906 n=1 Tax=Xiphias gladius TaxID=8245 RepID=UPI001A9993CE|nr:uncharacterized protein LOC120802906 [Xiphias gladius]
MSSSRPRIPEEHLPEGVAPQQVLDNDAGGVDDIIGRPAEDGFPELILVVDDDEDNNLPVNISSGEEEEFEEDDREVDETDSESEIGEVWSGDFSNDSGYSTMTFSEEYLEDDLEDDFRPLLVVPARIPDAAPVCGPAAAPQQLMVGHPQVPVQPEKLPEQQVERPEGSVLPFSERLEECAPSTSGLSSSTKRTREENYTGQLSSKRPRVNSEENPEDAVPSTDSD